MNFILIGMPGSGKTTLGEKAAAALGLTFYDTDVLVGEYIRSKYQDWPPFDQFMREFLDAEQVVVAQLAKDAENALISTGAETALSPVNAPILRKLGPVIYIKRDPKKMMKEAPAPAGPEPRKLDFQDPSQWGDALYGKLLPQYQRLADYAVNNDRGEEAGLALLIKLIRTLDGRPPAKTRLK